MDLEGVNIAHDALFEWLLRRGDTVLVLGHHVSEWCGHSPVLEEDIALANIALDLIGQARLWLTYAGEVEGKGRGENDLAYLRDVWDFRNLLIAEQPNGDFGRTLMRQLFVDAHQVSLLSALVSSGNSRIAEIAAKSLKEANYHFDRSADLVIRLGTDRRKAIAECRRRLTSFGLTRARCSAVTPLIRKWPELAMRRCPATSKHPGKIWFTRF